MAAQRVQDATHTHCRPVGPTRLMPRASDARRALLPGPVA